ncbi:MAG: hypothetical protein COS37_00620 [Anaerolineae bacterium CG03_land_8_20_14_0_80_58_20]|nr:MAG: hypothetical protein AUJ21_00090 [Anaerolineae bacterium CG1_02_58_13]PIV28574.1 MAG: hypothetical protein COS37_00620 [Anaerolineae bacterium CG03_land_8_20_14_0_80_58_20]
MKSRAVQITRYFFYLLAALWLVVGINYLGQSDGQMIYNVIAGLMFASIFVFIALGANITRKPVYWVGVIFLAICIVLVIFDQFGLADLVALILFIVPLVIMLAKRKEFIAA